MVDENSPSNFARNDQPLARPYWAAPVTSAPSRAGTAQYGLASGWSFLAKFDGEFSSTTSIYSGTGMVRKAF